MYLPSPSHKHISTLQNKRLCTKTHGYIYVQKNTQLHRGTHIDKQVWTHTNKHADLHKQKYICIHIQTYVHKVMQLLTEVYIDID